MKTIQKIRDFFAKLFSKNFWRERWLDIRAFPCKEVNAEILETLCGYLNPSYSGVIDRFQHEMREGERLKSSVLHHAFYSDRNEFLTDIRKILDKLYPHSQWADSLYEELRGIYAPIPDEFKNLVKQNGLEAYIRVRENPVIGAAIEFVNIKVRGKTHLNLGGRFARWSFKNVKFFDSFTVSVYPFFLVERPKVDFKDSAFCGDFTCLFAFVENISIANTKFKRPVLIGADIKSGENRHIVAQWKRDMLSNLISNFRTYSTVKFSKNRCEDVVILYNRMILSDGRNVPGINMVRFEGSNIIGGLSLPEINLANIGSGRPLDAIISDGKRQGRYQQPVGVTNIGDIHFDMNERIKTDDKEEMLLYKDFFIALKNKAIAKRDREAEFKFGRQERYFDWRLADRWQDEFTLGWSQWVSDNGISWIRPIYWLLGVQAVLAAAFICSGWCDWDWWVWGKFVAESLNPLSSVESGCTRPIYTAIYGVARKIFLFLFLYEIIKVFRRFSK